MKTIVSACENCCGMSRGSFCTNSQLRALRKWRILMCFGIFYMFCMFLYVFSSKTIYFAHFEAPGILKTAPACIFHHIWYGQIKVSIIFDHIHCILHHICCILYHRYGISYNKMSPGGGTAPWGSVASECPQTPGLYLYRR